MRPRTARILCCSLILSGVLLARPSARAHTLRALSSISGRSAAALRRLSLASGLRYIDMAYPSVDSGIPFETGSDSENLR